MKTPERFNRAIKALVQAFFNDHLAKGNCTACAVGNMVAACHNVKVTDEMIYNMDRLSFHDDWSFLGYTETDEEGNVIAQHKGCVPTPFLGYRKSMPSEIRLAQELISKTGYTDEEILTIEYAFETSTRITYDKYKHTDKSLVMQDQFNGLMAVVEVLCKLDNIEPTEYKKAFEYTADFKPVTILSVVD